MWESRGPSHAIPAPRATPSGRPSKTRTPRSNACRRNSPSSRRRIGSWPAGRRARPSAAEPLIPSVGPEVAAAAIAAAPTGDSSEPGERTWGETPAEFAAELTPLSDEAADTPSADRAPLEPQQREVPAVVFEDTQPIPAITDEVLAENTVAESPLAGSEPDGDPETTLTPEPQTPTASAASAEAAVSSIAAETAALVAQAPAEPQDERRLPHPPSSPWLPRRPPPTSRPRRCP